MGEKNAAVVLAAGKGTRLGGPVRKQFLELGGIPLVCHALRQFEDFEEIGEILLVVGEEDIEYCRREIVEAQGFCKVSRVLAGGKERYDSVRRGLEAMEARDYVLIHDGARPFPDRGMLERIMKDVRRCGAATAAMPVKDTIKIGDREGFAVSTPDRSSLWMIQTPQAFAVPLILEAYRKLYAGEIRGITDDAMVVEQMTGHAVKLTQGSYRNIKITTPEDLLIAESFLKNA